MSEPLYPEHEKLLAIKDSSQVIGVFLDWLSYKNFVIAEYPGGRGELYPITQDSSKLLAEFFEIDERKLEKEKRAMLDAIRTPTGGRP